ncbi:GNAT family N-acetyltransferase [Nocardioides sp. BGMRC 2183]|nr:GNAT family N-acetyltransferase [Nocardioides sp. BGMRC 2183]
MANPGNERVPAAEALGQSPYPLPSLPAGWVARVPGLPDVPALVVLRSRDQAAGTGSRRVDADGIESEVAGPASWTRRQAIVATEDGAIQGWITVHDRAAGRALIWGWFHREVDGIDEIAARCYRWAEETAVAMARFRGVSSTRLDASPFADDGRQREWLAQAGYQHRRTWLHMERPVAADEQVPELRPGVVIRPVSRHDNGMPVAADLQMVHQMLEESFEDHFNSYRESFPEFVQRLREDPGHRWDHWWLAFVEAEHGDAGVTLLLPAGATVCSVLARDADGFEGSYVEYIGVNRNARGRGVAKGLLNTVIADARDRGRDRVGLEVDADSPTSADQLYRSMGWETDYATESWFKDLTV